MKKLSAIQFYASDFEAREQLLLFPGVPYGRPTAEPAGVCMRPVTGGVLLPSSLTEERTQRRHDSCGNRKRHSEQRPPRSCGLISKPTHKRLHPPQHTSPASRTKLAITNPVNSPRRPHYAHPNRLHEIFQTAVPCKDHAVSLVADIRLNAPGIETWFDANSD